MSKLTEHYQTKGVFNEHNFADGQVAIGYTTADNGRGGRSAYLQIYKDNESTDPQAAWYKTFTVFLFLQPQATHAKAKAAVLEAAKVWASAKYGINEWARTPYGSWMDAGVVKRRMAELGKPKCL